MDANPSTPIPAGQPAPRPTTGGNIQDGIAPLGPKAPPNLASGSNTPEQPLDTQAPSTQTPVVQAPASQEPNVQAPAGQTTAGQAQTGQGQTGQAPAVPAPEGAQAAGTGPVQTPAIEPIKLEHPTVVTTAQLKAGDATVSLFGIEGLAGEPAQGLQGYINATDPHLLCQAQQTAGFVCLMSDGTDVAQVALVNGAARTRPDAPDPYKEQEAAAQAARRGIWVNLPPPPETVKHPTVQDTATIADNNHVYPLDGIIGLGQPYAGQLQGYISSAGDSLTCSVQQASGTYICLLPDGTDIAKAALVNGAARVAADAPDAYRIQQADALNNRRGLWLNPPPGAVAVASSAQASAAEPSTAEALAQPDQYAFAAGDDGADGVSYVGGAPTAVIDGEEVFLVLGAGALGWGYYDHWHHWRGAPDRYRDHLERFHPEGRGLRGYRTEAMLRHDGGIRHEESFRREGGLRHDVAAHPGGMAPHAGPETAHPGFAQHAAMSRPGMGAPMARPAATGGGFVRPNAVASAGGFHPGAAAGGFRPGAAGGGFHAAAPAFHPAASGGGGKHK